MRADINQISDEKLAQAVQKGKIEDFAVLVKRYEQKILRYAKKFLFDYSDAEDLVQEVFLKAYIHIQSFDAEKKFSPWLYRIAHNEFINAIKRKKREPLPLFNADIILPGLIAQETADQETDQKELRKILKLCLNKLIPKYREPLVLFYFEQLSYKEVADILHIPISTVGVRLTRAKKMMKSIYQKL